MRAAPELLGAPTIGGGSAGPWGGGGEVKYTFTAVRNSQKRRKTGSFTHILAYNSPKTPFFAHKYLTRYTHETFFVEYLNFKIFGNLSHCGVIPVRSFGSHIRPQLHGLGLMHDLSGRHCDIGFTYCSLIQIGLPLIYQRFTLNFNFTRVLGAVLKFT